MRNKQTLFVLAFAMGCMSLNSSARSQDQTTPQDGRKHYADKVKYGVNHAMSFSTLTNIKGTGFTENVDLGLFFDISLNEKNTLYLHTSVLLRTRLGASGIEAYSLNAPDLDSMFLGGSIERQLKYKTLHALVRYRFTDHLFIDIGPMLGLMTNATDIFYTGDKKRQFPTYSNKVTKDYQRFDIGIETGIGLHLDRRTGLNLGVRYYQGFMDINRESTANPLRNQSLYLFLSIPVCK